MTDQNSATNRLSRCHSLQPLSTVNVQHDAITNCCTVGMKKQTTCWFNSVIQLLYHLPAFRREIIEAEEIPHRLSTPFRHREVLLSSLKELFILLLEKKQVETSKIMQYITKVLGEDHKIEDASEFLAWLLNRIRQVSPKTVEELFVGSCTADSASASTLTEEFMQFTLLAAGEQSKLVDLLESSLIKTISSKSITSSDLYSILNSNPGNQRHSFSTLPPVFLIDLCRVMSSGSNLAECVKVNHVVPFPSVMFMDRFQLENKQQVSDLADVLQDLPAIKQQTEIKLQSMATLLQSVPQFETVYQSYQNSVDYATAVDFDLMRSLNHDWEAEIQVKMNQLFEQSKQLEHRIELIQSRQLSTCRPFQLHAVIIHRSASLVAGHYWIYVWDSQLHVWLHIDNNVTQIVTWDSVVQDAFGGPQRASSAHTLVYIDSLKIDSLLGAKKDYVVGPTDVLRYLKDHTDVRTRHAAYGKSQTIKAVMDLVGKNETPPLNSCSLLYHTLDSERQRLHTACHEWVPQSVGDDTRLLHFGVYLLTNRVTFEPFVYWTLLQHFSSFSLLLEEETSPVCTAARHALAFIENSTTQEEKKLFIQWNTAYYQFRLIIRHVMNGITQVFSRNFSAAVPLAVKSLYLHHALMNNSLQGPSKSISPSVIHALIQKAVMCLSEELLENDLDSIGDMACTVLFDAIINWCEYSDADNMEAARSCSRRIVDQWGRQIKRLLGLAVECASLRMLTELQRKLLKVESVLNQPDENGNPTPFDFKGHIPETLEDGEKLALKWKQMWLICQEQNILSP